MMATDVALGVDTVLQSQDVTYINLSATIEGIDFPEEIWAWLDVLGDAIKATETEAELREKTFVADTPYKKVLLGGIHTYLSGLKAVYALLRMELVSQAAGQARLLCEGIITLTFIRVDPDQRAIAFLDYATIEAYEAASALIEWESATANPTPAAAVSLIRDNLKAEYDKIRPRYQFTDRNGRTRRYSNWANTSIADMAKVSKQTERLYELIYRQLSSYVHGSAWSFRHIPSYTPRYYDANVVLADIGQVTLGTLVVWQVFTEFVETNLGWDMHSAALNIVSKAQQLAKLTGVKSKSPDT